MSPESPSSSWDERERRRGRRYSPELNLNQSLNNREEYAGDKDGTESRAKPGRDVDQLVDEGDRARIDRSNDYQSTRGVGGLDLNVGQSLPEVLLNKQSPNSKHVAAASRRDRSPSPSGHGRRSPSSLGGRRRSHKKQHTPSPGRRAASPPVPARAPSPLSKRSRPARKSSSSIEEKLLSSSPQRKRGELSAEAQPRKRSPYDEEKRRSVTPLRRRSPSSEPVRQMFPSSGDKRRSVTPLRKRAPSPEARKQRSPRTEDGRRSLTPLKRQAPSVEHTRKGSPSPGERRRSPSEAARKKDRSRTPIHHRERSRTRSPVPRRTPTQQRRSRSPLPSRRRSPRRSPRRDRSPGVMHSPRRRSSPTRHRGSRRDRRPSPGGRRGWSPVHNRSNGVGKPGNNLFIAGFNFITTERDLERKFSKYGRVMDVRIVRDKRSGESRGFGFLTLERDEDADAAIKALDQTEWNGRIVLVEKAKTPTRF